MTLGVAYTWHDKIIMMFDSRETNLDNGEYTDVKLKIYPYEKRFVIGHSGFSKLVDNNTNFTVKEFIDEFITKHKNQFPMYLGKDILKGLLQSWNLSWEKLGLTRQKCDASFILCEWVDNKVPMICVGGTLGEKVSINNFGGAIGEDAALKILSKYINRNFDQMTLEETLDHFNLAFGEVSKDVKTVGGPINVYVLGKKPSDTGWFKIC